MANKNEPMRETVQQGSGDPLKSPAGTSTYGPGPVEGAGTVNGWCPDNPYGPNAK